ncbi:MAG: tetrahydromethanopterin S-methyltransferase subunit H [Thermoplasmata archaeon]|nr:tetrahydromethanopterin S-methyltransferase subunit H [Thermoplasmata archaeon]
MLNFSKEQKIVTIGDVKLGGQPGELPTVLFGTVFYGKKYRTHEPEAMAEAEGFINTQEEMSQLTGNPGVIDIFIGSEEQAEIRLGFVLDRIPGDRPICIDVPESDVKAHVLRYAGETGISSRLIYNSLNLGLGEAELEALKEYSPGCAIVLGYNPRNMSTDGRVEVLESGAGLLEKGIIDIAIDAGIKNILVDTGATPFDHNVAETLRAIPVMKNKWGRPTGCAIHNTVESWLWMKEYRKTNRDVYLNCDIGANAMPVILGADYAIYGPMRNAGRVFPFVAMVDKFMAEGAEDYFGVEIPDHHPKRRLK